MSAVARMIADGSAVTKADLTRSLDVARSTTSVLVERLIGAGLVVHAGLSEKPAGRGRPGENLTIDTSWGTVLAADVGDQSTLVRVADLGQRVIAATSLALGFQDDPEKVLVGLVDSFDEQLRNAGADRRSVRAVVVGLPASIDIRSLMPVIRQPTNPLWDGFPVSAVLGKRFDCPVLLENDVNLRAVAESRSVPDMELPLIYVAVGTGVGGGIVGSDGTLQRGADGAAGEIGHVGVRGAHDVRCACGKFGCLQAVASEGAMLERLRSREVGTRVLSEVGRTDLADRLSSGDVLAAEVVQESALAIGEVVATLVQLHNPARVVLGGALIDATESVLATVRSIVYRSAHPLATRNLYVGPSVFGRDGALIGATIAGIEHALAPIALSVI